MTIWVLGDQLTDRVGPLTRASTDRDVLLVEATDFADRKPYHPHKLILLFSAMRHFRDELRANGHTVYYRRAETFSAALRDHFREHDESLVAMRPNGHRAGERLQALVDDAGGELRLVENEQFLCSPDEFDAWAGDGGRLRHEEFYRRMRRETGILMDGDEPVGGEFNFDDRNRETPPPDHEFPEPPRFEPDDTTREVAEWVADSFDTWGDPDGFFWPVTRSEALTALERFVEDRLPEFGHYQDAMLDDEWALNHALLSAAMNVGLLGPREVVERAVEAYHRRDLPLNSVEGFVRQVIGWREFLRHVYRRRMPELAEANRLDATEDLPPLYTTGETDMACLDAAVGGVYDRGYAHHIQRLMILSNFALTYGVEPRQLNEWFHYGFVDAYHWVTTPNVVEMGLYADGAFATKPYAASANYIDRMSDHCEDCPYDEDRTVGEGACPFNSLYWDFLADNEDQLRSNHRMGLVYSHLDDKREAGDLEAIRRRADAIRGMARDGDL